MRRSARGRGFAPMALVGLIAVIILLGAGGYFYASRESAPDAAPAIPSVRDVEPPPSSPAASLQITTATKATIEGAEKKEVEIQKTEQKDGVMTTQKNSPQQEYHNPFSGLSQKASCPNPFIFDIPIDISKATSVLYPGQVRNGDYKPHGGFRFDGLAPDDISVTAPIDAYVVAGSRSPTNGEIQYMFEFENSCGIRYRLGHLLTLAPKFQAIAEKFPLPIVLDTRTTQVYPPIVVKKGEVIATAVGLTGAGAGGTGQVNTFVDWGVYDYRQKNKSSQDPAWAASHTSDTYQYGVCWFDWISAEDRARVLALPSSDGVSGKQSDYCK